MSATNDRSQPSNSFKNKNGNLSTVARSNQEISKDRNNEYQLNDMNDVNQEEYNVKNEYKQIQDSLEEKEQEFIQHLKTLSVLSSSSSSSSQSSFSNASNSNNIRSSDNVTSGSSHHNQKNKSILLIDEFLDLRKSRRQFISMLYNHIQNDNNQIIIPYKMTIQSLQIELYKKQIELNSHHENNNQQDKYNHHHHQLEQDYQKLLKTLDSKENELIRIKLYQEKQKNHIHEELSAEYSRKLSNELDQLTLKYEAKLRLLESKLNTITTTQHHQQQQQQYNYPTYSNVSDVSTSKHPNKKISDNSDNNSDNYTKINHTHKNGNTDNHRYEVMEEMYLSKLQKYKEVAVALSEREHALKEVVSTQDLKLQACLEKIEFLKGINAKLDTHLNDEKTQRIELQIKLTATETKFNQLTIQLHQQSLQYQQEKEVLQHNHDAQLKQIDDKIRLILQTKDDKFEKLQNQYNQLLHDKNDIQYMLQELNMDLKL